jgi:hypothetical protein
VFNSKEHNIFYCFKLYHFCLEFWNYLFIFYMIWVWDPCSSEYEVCAERLWSYSLFLVSFSQHWLLLSLKLPIVYTECTAPILCLVVLYVSQGRWKCSFHISILLVLWSTCHIILNFSLQHLHLTYGKTLTCRAVCNAYTHMICIPKNF